MAEAKVFKRVKKVSRRPDESQSNESTVQSSRQFTSICVNPLDRFCDLLLSWNIREDFVSTGDLDKNDASVDEDKQKGNVALQKIPTSFPDGYASYLRIFERFLMEEVKASILSKVFAKPFSSLQKGYTYIYQDSGVSTVMPIIQLSCSKFFWNPGNVCSNNSNCYKGGTTMSIMDLVFISLDTCDCAPSVSPFYDSKATISSLITGAKSKYFLGVVTSRTKIYPASSQQSNYSAGPSSGTSEHSSSYSYSIHVSRTHWESYKFYRKQLLREQQLAGKWTGEGGAVLAGSSNLSAASGPGIFTSTIKANICVLEGLTSSWREYLALQQMHHSPMLPFTLNPLQREMPTIGSGSSEASELMISGGNSSCSGKGNCDQISPGTPPSTPIVDLTEEPVPELESEPEPEPTRPVSSRRFLVRRMDGAGLPEPLSAVSAKCVIADGNNGSQTGAACPLAEVNVDSSLSISLPQRQFSGDAPCFSPISVSPAASADAYAEYSNISGKSEETADLVAASSRVGTGSCTGFGSNSSKCVKALSVQNGAVVSNSFRQISSTYSSIFTAKYNKSQLTAIEMSCGVDDSGELSDSGFVLIQGPPGTGKTHTVLGLLNTLHLKQYNCFYARVVREVLGPRGLACRRMCRTLAGELEDAATLNCINQWLNLLSEVSVQHKPHILVTAPSNTAIDNICTRVVDKGFLDGNGHKYYPYIVRVKASANAHANAKACADHHTILLEDATERIVGMSLKQREERKLELKKSIRQLLVKLRHTQSLLLVLVSTYNEWYVQHCVAAGRSKSVHNALRGYELRVDSQTAKPYWVDHVNKVTVVHPSPPVAGQLPATQFPDYAVGVDSLPEYRVHSQALTHLVDQIVLENIKYKRLVAIREIESGATKRQGQGNIGSSTSALSKSYEIRKVIEQSIIQEAHLVMTTLNSVGLSSLDDAQFHTVIVDEAGQCVEPSVLIPLSRVNCKRVVLVGDPMQLPATLFSCAVRQCGYDTSLLERLINGGHVVNLLNTQYRMIPEIAEFPSTMFYGGRVLNGRNVCDPQYRPKFIKSAGTAIDYHQAPEDEHGDDDGSRAVKCNTSHNANIRLQGTIEDSASDCRRGGKVAVKSRFPGFVFFDLLTSKDQQLEGGPAVTSSSSVMSAPTMSRSNPEEAKLCLGILQALMREIVLVGDVYSIGHVGVITPYQEQVNELSSLFRAAGYFPVDGKSKSFAVSVKVPLSASHQAQMAHRGSSRPLAALGGGSGTTSKYITIESIEFNSVDGFQGREKDVVIISCVRANDGNSIGFLSDLRRMNVVLTRARFGLYVVGSQETLSSNKAWSKLLQHAQERGCLVVAPHANVDVAVLLEEQLGGKVSKSDISATTSLPSTSSMTSTTTTNLTDFNGPSTSKSNSTSTSTSSVERLVAQTYAHLRGDLEIDTVNRQNANRSAIGTTTTAVPVSRVAVLTGANALKRKAGEMPIALMGAKSKALTITSEVQSLGVVPEAHTTSNYRLGSGSRMDISGEIAMDGLEDRTRALFKQLDHQQNSAEEWCGTQQTLSFKRMKPSTANVSSISIDSGTNSGTGIASMRDIRMSGPASDLEDGEELE